jgi:hypothetical protein
LRLIRWLRGHLRGFGDGNFVIGSRFAFPVHLTWPVSHKPGNIVSGISRCNKSFVWVAEKQCFDQEFDVEELIYKPFRRFWSAKFYHCRSDSSLCSSHLTDLPQICEDCLRDISDSSDFGLSESEKSFLRFDSIMSLQTICDVVDIKILSSTVSSHRQFISLDRDTANLRTLFSGFFPTGRSLGSIAPRSYFEEDCICGVYVWAIWEVLAIKGFSTSIVWSSRFVIVDWSPTNLRTLCQPYLRVIILSYVLLRECVLLSNFTFACLCISQLADSGHRNFAINRGLSIGLHLTWSASHKFLNIVLAYLRSGRLCYLLPMRPLSVLNLIFCALFRIHL